MRKILGFLAGAAASILPLASAGAATSTVTMNVSITVTSACNISVTDINFGSVPASALASSLTSTAAQGGLFKYTCGATSTTPALTAGNGANFNTTNRMLGVNGTFLPYSLNLPAIATFSGIAQTAQITATIPLQTTLPATDVYTDAVVLTLTY